VKVTFFADDEGYLQQSYKDTEPATTRKGDAMNRIVAAVLIAAASCFTARGQDFKKVVDIVVDIENSLKAMIAKEAADRKAEIGAVRSEVAALRSIISKTPSTASPVDAANGASSDAWVERIEALEKKVGSLNQPAEIQLLSQQLGSLLQELKKAIEESKRPAATGPKVTSESQSAPVSTYSVSGQIRHRSEVDGKSFKPESRATWFNLLRSRVNVTASPLADVKVFVQVQDARLFGGGNPALARGTMDGAAKALDFHQAYFSVTNLFDSGLSLKIGRQELVYGNERLIGGVGWSNTGRAFDAAILSYNSEHVTVDAFTSKLVGSVSTSFSENLRGVYSTFRVAQQHLVDAFALVDDNTTPVSKGVDAGKSKLVRYTVGTFVRGKPQPFDYEFEFAYQGGKSALNDTSARASINAYLLSGSLGFTVDPASKWRVGVLYTRLSGDDDPKDNAVGEFNTLFATNHKFYGYMDYFPGVYPSYGLNNIALSTSINLSNSVSLAVDLHHFALDYAVQLTDAGGNKSEKKTLGREVDITATIKYNANLSFIGGGSAFIPADVMRVVRGDATSYWFYLMTIVNF